MTNEKVTKPVPKPNSDTTWFWNACNNKHFLIQKCDNCQSVRFYPSSVCPDCHDRGWSTVEANGSGTVESYTIIRYAPNDAFEEDTPYVLALIEVEEGIRVMGNVLDCEPSEVNIGDSVSLKWIRRDGQNIYQFTLDKNEVK